MTSIDISKFSTQYSFRTKLNNRFRIERRDVDKWCISDGFGMCLNKKMKWEYEPLPSSRTEAFLKRSRFSLDEATDLVTKLIDKDGGLA